MWLVGQQLAKCHQCVSLCRSGEKMQKLYYGQQIPEMLKEFERSPPKIKQQEPHKNPKGRQRSVRLLLKMIELFWNGCIFPNSHWLLKKFQWAVSLFGRLLEEPLDAFYRWCHQECFGEYSPRVDNLQVIYTIWYPQFSILYFTFGPSQMELQNISPTASWQTFPFFARSPFFWKVTKSQPQKMTLGTVHSQT